MVMKNQNSPRCPWCTSRVGSGATSVLNLLVGRTGATNVEVAALADDLTCFSNCHLSCMPSRIWHSSGGLKQVLQSQSRLPSQRGWVHVSSVRLMVIYLKTPTPVISECDRIVGCVGRSILLKKKIKNWN